MMADEQSKWWQQAPLAVVFALAIQTLGVVWWLSALNTRADINILEVRQLRADMKALGDKVETPTYMNSVAISSLQTELQALRARIDQIQINQTRVMSSMENMERRR